MMFVNPCSMFKHKHDPKYGQIFTLDPKVDKEKQVNKLGKIL